ncbi:MAG: CRISPR system precrRNA processing endoribonuclease RAMP protein Cas6 [Micropruina sp.]|nr:CRISPR system precrRNA processing endoribonuclease RAMP protein Cas6 [Micropruina sp.]
MFDIVGVSPRYVHNAGIHNFLSAWFAETREEHVDPKAYSLKQRISGPGGAQIVLGVIDDELEGLVAAIPPGQPMQLGANTGRYGFVAHTPQRVRDETWAELSTPWNTNQWRIRLRSPVAFRRSGLDQPWPAPFQVLDSLRRRWLLGRRQPLIAEDAIDGLARGIAVTGADISTEECRWPPKKPVFGARGAVEWTWVGGPAAHNAGHRGARTVEQLLRLAEFSGVGAYPQHGLGAVDVEAQRVNPRRPR